MFFIPINDRGTVELLYEVKQGRKSQRELVTRLKDYRRFKQAKDFIEKLEMELQIAFGLCKEERLQVKIPKDVSISFLKSAYGTKNGKRSLHYETDDCLHIIYINRTKGKAVIGIDQEALSPNG